MFNYGCLLIMCCKCVDTCFKIIINTFPISVSPTAALISINFQIIFRVKFSEGKIRIRLIWAVTSQCYSKDARCGICQFYLNISWDNDVACVTYIRLRKCHVANGDLGFR